MLQATEIETKILIRTLRVYVQDLNISYSPFIKDEKYLQDLSGWIAYAAQRIEDLDKHLSTKGTDK